MPCRAALTRAHSQPQRPADVVEVRGVSPLHGLLEPITSDQFALTDELLRLRARFAGTQPRPQRVEAPVLGVGQRLHVRAAGTIDPELVSDPDIVIIPCFIIHHKPCMLNINI